MKKKLCAVRKGKGRGMKEIFVLKRFRRAGLSVERTDKSISTRREIKICHSRWSSRRGRGIEFGIGGAMNFYFGFVKRICFWMNLALNESTYRWYFHVLWDTIFGIIYNSHVRNGNNNNFHTTLYFILIELKRRVILFESQLIEIDWICLLQSSFVKYIYTYIISNKSHVINLYKNNMIHWRRYNETTNRNIYHHSMITP